MYQQLTYRITRIDNIQAVFSRKLLPKQHASNFKYNSLDLSPIPDLITWDFSCLVSTKDLEKAFPQKRHLNGFSPVWFRMWSLRRWVCVRSFLKWICLALTTWRYPCDQTTWSSSRTCTRHRHVSWEVVSFTEFLSPIPLVMFTVYYLMWRNRTKPLVNFLWQVLHWNCLGKV